MRRTVGVFVVLAVSAAGAACFAKGLLRVVLVILSGLFAVVAVWIALWTSLLGSINNPRVSAPRAARRPPLTDVAYRPIL
jgi:hypothetical protein